ncbi:MAG: VWA domain-containing protein [Planctomycetota bacterium]
MTRTTTLSLSLVFLAGCGSVGGALYERSLAPSADRVAASEPQSSEEYTHHGVRDFVDPAQDPLSTFSVDVDTGSYTVARRKLREGMLPPPAAVRVEEFVNYFRQDYPDPAGDDVFAIHTQTMHSPWRPGKVVLQVGLQTRRIDAASRKPANLVFLVDVSGSMSSPDKLGLLKQSLEILTRSLRPDDTVAIATYAGSVDTVLAPTRVAERDAILDALDDLEAGGSTAMGSGLELAYRLASERAHPEVNSRVIVCSDGDANVGATHHSALLEQIRDYRGRGITLGTVGFGMGNYRDTLMEQLADAGDGSYAYVDGLAEARRLFSEDLIPSLELVARDAKIQVEFDPARVARYRLIGYENRAILDEAFRDEAVDAGEVGAGHTVTALYELELQGEGQDDLGRVRVRYEPPAGGEAREQEVAIRGQVLEPQASAGRLRFTAAVAEFAELLRQSPHAATPWPELLAVCEDGLHTPADEREHELLDLIRRAARIARATQ